MHWILQENLFKEAEWDTLVQTLERFGIPYSVHKVVPFVGELIPAPEPKQDKVICFGSYSMRHSAKAFGWTPGVYDLEPFDFKVQCEHWGAEMLNYDSKVVPFKDAHWEDDGLPRFLRPIHDSKVFPGKVYEWREFRDWQRNVCVLELDYGNSLTAETLVQVSTLKKIYEEYRYWIVDGKIVTKSLYKRGDRVMYSSEVSEYYDSYVLDMIGIWQPHRAFVIDVCSTPDGPRIVEINTINAAGFYAGDIQKLVMALEELEN